MDSYNKKIRTYKTITIESGIWRELKDLGRLKEAMTNRNECPGDIIADLLVYKKNLIYVKNKSFIRKTILEY